MIVTKGLGLNHLVESDAKITMLDSSDVLIRVLGVTFVTLMYLKLLADIAVPARLEEDKGAILRSRSCW